MSASDPSTSQGEGRDPRARHLLFLAEELGIELPPFSGPLVAFQLDGHRGPADPVFLGGDLHAVHPSAGGPILSPPQDPSLDTAMLTLTDHVHESLDLHAVEGIWCGRLSDERLLPAPYFSLTDTDGRLRTWLLLPPPRLMVGIAHLWLPSVPPPGGLPRPLRSLRPIR